MTIIHPWLLLLLLPISAYVYSRRHAFSPLTVFLRMLSAGLLIFALSSPSCSMSSKGIDVVVVIDRSSSMPGDVDRRASEIISLLEEKQQNGDRIAVISITKDAVIEKNLTDDSSFQGFQIVTDVDNSHLNSGLQMALDLIPPARSGRILLLTDGENTGSLLSSSRKEAQSRAIPIHVRYLPQSREHDVSITNLNYPKQSSSGEPVQISAWISSPMEQDARIILKRNGQVIASGNKKLTVGNNSISLLDAPQQGGINQYEIEVEASKDQRRENNHAVFGTLVKGPKRILILATNAQESSLSTLLRRNKVELDIADPRKIELSMPMLTRYQALVLQDVPSTFFQIKELNNIVRYVEDMGGGLLMTGGPTSFGAGGYLHSPLEKILPVQLQIREEHRKVGLALGIALDRSGSMSVSVGPNLTKMDLANQGAAAAVTLLTAVDSTTVYAVDTEPHEILPLQDVQDGRALSRQVLGIKSQGGGIYVGEALRQLYEVLPRAKQKNRHVALFADANDAVNQGDVFGIISKMREENITISVIALGTPKDSDAAFLADVALNGGGDIYFTTNPTELPKLFAMDTMLASKAAFSDKATKVETVLGATGLGGKRFTNFPTIEGYNIAYFKESAQLGYRTLDTDPIDPLLAHHRYGLGQTVAYLGQIDGSYGQNITRWNSYSPLFHSILQAISASQPPSLPYVGVEQQGNQQVYTVESKTKIPEAVLIDPNGKSKQIRFVEIDDDLYQAHMEQDLPGIHVVSIKGEEGAITLPPTSLPYSNEFQPRNTTADQRELQRLTRLTNGQFNSPINLLFEGSRESKSLQSLQGILACCGLLVLLLEIADRRLRLFSGIRLPSSSSLSLPNFTFKKKHVASHSQKSLQKEAPLPEPKKPEPKRSGLQEALKKAKRKR